MVTSLELLGLGRMTPVNPQAYALQQQLQQQAQQQAAAQEQEATRQNELQQPFFDKLTQNPAISNALLRFGTALMDAGGKGLPTSSGLAQGFNTAFDAYEKERMRQQQQQLENLKLGILLNQERRDEKKSNLEERKLNFDIEQAQKEAAMGFGVQSGGFEGDIARASYVLSNPQEFSQGEIGRAQAVMDVAQRLQGAYNPVTGSYELRQRAAIGGTPSAPVSAGGGGYAPQSMQQLPQVQTPQVQGASIPPQIGLSSAMMNTPKGQMMLAQEQLKLQSEQAGRDIKYKQELQQTQPKVESGLRASMDNIDNVLKITNDAMKLTESPTATGIAGAITENIAGSSRSDLVSAIESLKANAFVNSITEMRKNSPTGGAVGNVSDAEGSRLASMQANLNPNQSTERLREQITNFASELEKSRNRLAEAYQRDYGNIPEWLQNREFTKFRYGQITPELRNIKAMYQNGSITKEQAIEMYKQAGGKK